MSQSTPSDKAGYLERLQRAIEHLHGCKAVYRETVPVLETFRGQAVWQGEVEVFDLNGHPEAKKAYAWSHQDGPKDMQERFVTVLELAPVDSPLAAVRASIVAEFKNKISN